MAEMKCGKDEQIVKISECLRRELNRGDKWYLISAVWFKQWKKYVGFDERDQTSKGKNGSHPGPIDNSPLLKEQEGILKLKDHLINEVDYSLLPEDGWMFLVQYYDALNSFKDIIQRKVIEQGMYVKHCKVEIYPMSFKLRDLRSQQERIHDNISRNTTLESLEILMREMFDIHDDVEVRLWNKYMINTYEHLNKREQTVQEAGLCCGQIVIVETRNKDGTWPRGGTGQGYVNTNGSFKVSKTLRQKINEEKEKERHLKIQREIGDVRAQGLVVCDNPGCDIAARLYCVPCQEKTCSGCAGSHLLKNSKKGHNMVEYKDKTRHRDILYCKTHEHEKCELYCEHCEIPVCSKCVAGKSHKGHDITETSAVFDIKRTCVIKERDSINDHIKLLKEQLKTVDKKWEESEENYRNLVTEVVVRKDDILKAVETVTNNQLQKIEGLKTSDQNQIQAQKEELEQQIAKANAVLESCEGLLEGHSPSELFSFESMVSDLKGIPEMIALKEHNFKKGSLLTEDIEGGFGDIN